MTTCTFARTKGYRQDIERNRKKREDLVIKERKERNERRRKLSIREEEGKLRISKVREGKGERERERERESRV
jgi:hypothetical protein